MPLLMNVLHRTALVLVMCSSAMALAQSPAATKPAMADPGARVYAANCVACHQDNGQGVVGVFPPLVGHVPGLLARAGGRDYLLRVLLFGLMGEISINGQNYSGAMPPWVSLGDSDVAAVLNYAATAWENKTRLPADFKPFQAAEIAAVRSEKLASSAVLALRRKLISSNAQDGSAATSSLVTFTSEQAEEGKFIYQRNCADCHGSTLDNGEFGGAPLRGAWFQNKWGKGSVAPLYAFTKAKMPPDRPGAMSDKVYADVVAFILSANGYKASDKALPLDPKAQQLLTLKRD